MANTHVYLLTDFSCCEDFEKFLKAQNHANRALLDTLTQKMVDDWNKKACNLAILGGNLCLLDKDGKTIASVPMLLQDGDTIARDPVTGEITCVKVKVKGLDKSINLWMGTTAEYAAIKTKSPADTVYFFTNVNLYDVYTTLTGVEATVRYVMAGSILVPNAKHADNADKADEAAYSVHSSYADGAGRALEADHAAAADTATNATDAENATNDGNGKKIDETYGDFSKEFTFSGILAYYVTLPEKGATYQIRVGVSDSNGESFESSAIVFFNGKKANKTILNVVFQKLNKRIIVYRLNITVDGFVTVQKGYRSEDVGTTVEFSDFGEVTSDGSVSIGYRKIL